MTSWMPGAAQRPISKNYTPTPRTRRDGIVLHTAASEGTGADHATYWNRDASAQASSTFYVDRDGTITQLMPLEARSWATVDGNWRTCSVETQGQGTEPWTDAQVTALARIVAWASSVEGWPIRAMETTAPTQRGVGWHSLTYGGESWNPNGHACPGPKRVAQIPTIIARAKSGATNQEDDMQLTDTITRPDGHKATVEQVLGYADKRIETMATQIDELQKVCRSLADVIYRGGVPVKDAQGKDTTRKTDVRTEVAWNAANIASIKAAAQAKE